MPLYVCRTWEGEVRAQQGQELAVGACEPARQLRNAASGRAAEGSAEGPALGRGLERSGRVLRCKAA